jgi:hypothetical protein
MKKQFYKVPLVKPSQRLQKQRQPEWKVFNVDDSEFKCGTAIRNVNVNVKERGCKWEYNGNSNSNSNNKGRSNNNKKGKGEVRNRFQKERISYEMVKSKSIGRVIKSRECARLNKEMFDNKDDEEIKMVFYNVGGVRTKAMKNPLELNGVRFNSENVSVNENENECECECDDNVCEKEKSVLKYNNNESNFIDNLNRVFETSKNYNEISCNNYNNIKVKDEDYDDIHNYISKPIDIDNNKTNMKETNEYNNKQEYLFDNNNHNHSNILDSNYMTKLSNTNDDTYNKYKYNIDSLSQGQIHTYNDFQPKITSNEYNTNNPNINPQSNSNPFQQYNTSYNINDISQTNNQQPNLNDINTLLSQTATTTADKLSTNLPETSLQYKYQYSDNKLIYKYN